VITGSISTAGEQDRYAFDATQGESIILRVSRATTTSTNFFPAAMLFSPNGQQVGPNIGDDIVTRTLTASGTFTVVVSAGQATGDYEIILQRTKNPCQATALSCGATLTGSIDKRMELDAYTFTAVAGDAVAVNMINITEGFQPLLTLVDPDGRILTLAALRSPLRSGAYALLVSSRQFQTGSYEFTFQRTKNPCQATALACGVPQTGTITRFSQLSAHTFNLAAGEKIALKLMSTLTLELSLYDPDGESAGYTVSYNNDSLVPQLTKAGTYTVLVSNGGGNSTNRAGNYTGSYQVIFQRTKDPCNPTLLEGCRGEGALTPQAPIGTFVFNGTAGQRVEVRLESITPDLEPEMELFDPDGRKIGSNNTRIVLTPGRTGVYTILVNGGARPAGGLPGSNRQSGSFTLSLSNVVVRLFTPNGGEALIAGSNVAINWQSSAVNPALASQEIRFSADGGASYPTVIASGLAANIQSFLWNIPTNLFTTRGRILVIARDSASNACQDESNANFAVLGFTPNQNIAYQYDELSRLTRVSYEGGATVSYTYDALGNRLTETIAAPAATLAAVTTAAASSITATNATLNGQVNPNGSTTNVWFEWGTSNTLASFVSTATQATGTGNTSQMVSANLSNLIPGTTYYYRLASSNSAGIAKGPILSFTTAAARPAVSASAANYSREGLARESIVAAFGDGLATGDPQSATTIPLPTTLAGTMVRVRDSAGIDRLAPLFFVSLRQVNYQVPPGTAAGTVHVIITSGDGTISAETVQITAVAPGIFTANSDGQGVAAAAALRVKADGSQSYEPVARFDAAQNKFVTAPLDLGPETDQVFLILFGTGLRYRSNLSAVACSIGGANAEVFYAGAQGGFVGLDQVNLRLPRSLAGRGEVEVALTVDGRVANPVKINIK
jgi:uncharacterized protein (TIGR03437 family)